MQKRNLLEHAQIIGERLVRSALWFNDSCTWKVNIPDRQSKVSKKSVEELAGVGIYQGVSGIILFLLALYKEIGGTKLYSTIEAALKYILLISKELSDNNFALHGGRIGVAYTLYQAYNVLKKEELYIEGFEILRPLIGNENKDFGLDVIAGAAGAIPALLKMSEISENNSELEMAILLGENLISKAKFEPKGWSWHNGKSHIRNLCGYAHGASGIGHAFIELYNFTSKEKYLYAAEQAFLYERQFFNETKLNWPDFRHMELTNYIYENRIVKLKEAIQTRTLATYKKKYMHAWCHGSPGIALSRLRAYEITKYEVYKKEAELAIEGTKKSLPEEYNYSLCHGIGGNCEALIYASKILDDKNALTLAEEYALKGIKEYEEQNRPWQCGTMGGVSDPSLMLGEAGIGYYLLRLYSKEIDSILLVHPSEKKNRNTSSDGVQELRDEYTDTFFESTKKYLRIVLNNSSINKYVDFNGMIGGNESDIEIIYKKVKEHADKLDPKEKNKLKDFFKLEEAKYLQTLEITDFTEEYKNNLIKEDVDQIEWGKSKICLNETTFLLELKYNWPDKLEELNENKLDEEGQCYLLYQNNNIVFSKKLNPFLYLIFSNLQVPIEFEKLVQEIKKSSENNISQEELCRLIKEQLKVSYQASLVKII